MSQTTSLPDQLEAALAFNPDGLVPAIAQQHDTGEVLMMAWMNRASLVETLASGQVCFLVAFARPALAQGRDLGPDPAPRGAAPRLRRRHPPAPGRPDRGRLPHRAAQLLLPFAGRR